MGALEKIEKAGFFVMLTGDTSDTVLVEPEEMLTPKQRAWVEQHQADLANEMRKQMVVNMWASIEELLDKRNQLADQIRDLNSQLGFYKSLANIRTQKPESHQFTEDELKSLRRLVHPDKHNGSEAANRLTQKLNSLIG